MSTITISEFQIPDWRWGGVTGKLRLYASKNFTDSLGVPHLAGAVGSRTGFYQEIDLTISGSTVTVPSFTTYSTTDARPGSDDVRITGVLFDFKRTKRDTLFSGWRIPEMPTSTIWATLETFNRSNPRINKPENVLSDIETAALAQSIAGTLNDASTTIKGRTKLSATPVSATNPVAVGDNDPRMQASSDSYASLSAAVTSIGATPTDLSISSAFPSGATTTVPSTLRLSFTPSGSIVLGAGHTVTIQSSTRLWPTARIFSGTGLVRFTSNRFTWEFLSEWWGAKADGSTDSTAAIQACIDALDASNLSGTIKFQLGIYIIAGALVDTSGANCQIKLPSRSTMLSIRFEGATPAETVAHTRNDFGSVLRSTLATGNGNVIGAYGSQTIASVPNATFLSFHWENLSLQLPDNPTNSGIDLTKVPNLTIRNAQICTSVDPSVLTNITEPTTTTSYGLKLPPNNLPDYARVDNVQVYGFYNGVRAGELADVDNLFVTFCKVAVEIPNAYHPYLFGRVWIGYCPRGLKFTGGAASGLIGALIEAAQVCFEHQTSPAWVTSVYDIDEGSNHALGHIRFNLVKAGIGASALLNVNGALYINLENIFESWNSRWNIVYPFAQAAYIVNDPATFEIARRTPTSTDTLYASLNMTTKQSGTANIIAQIPFVNSALGTDEKRVAQIQVKTDGATNSGRFDFTTWNAGTSATRLSLTKSNVLIPSLPVHANNAAAVAAGLAVGTLYRDGSDPDRVCVVH